VSTTPTTPHNQTNLVPTGFPKLDEFFAAALPYVQGKLAPEAMVDKLGPSATGTKRLGIYPWILKWDNRGILNRIFTAARTATERYKLGLWDRWMDEYQEMYPPKEWRITKYGQHLFDYVRRQREERDCEQPYCLEELVDVAYTRAEAMNAVPSASGDNEIDSTIFVRQYTHESPQFVQALNDNPDTPSPERNQTVVIIYRSLHTLRPRFFYPNMGALLALARRTNTAPELRQQFSSVTDDMIEQGEALLIEHGVVMPR